ncbi:MAG: ATP-grasp domain-containing protein [Burkholderiaceae bacterium]
MAHPFTDPAPARARGFGGDAVASPGSDLLEQEQISIGHPASATMQSQVRDPILWLFGIDWAGLAAERFANQYEIRNAGFDLFSFPSNAALLWFDIDRFVERQVARGGRGLRAVLSHEEQFGALCAALIAERLGLPGTSPDAILRLQHKLLCRELIEQVAPEANVGFSLLECELGHLPDQPMSFPAFVKPIKASFSVLARKVESLAELRDHVRFGPFERLIIERLVKPFDDVCRRRLSCPVDARHMIVEESVSAEQFNLDGYVFDGQAHCIGVVDEIMYPGTQAFLRFAYPSRLPQAVQERAFDVAVRVLKAAGFDHGFFNMEFFYDRASDRLSVVEFNPRLAAQLADLYERVDGLDVHGMSVAMALGRDPSSVARLPSRAGAAASCALRTFDGSMPAPVGRKRLRTARERFADTIILTFDKSDSGRRREFKWMGSNRYAVLNLHGRDEADLQRHYETVCASLGWPAPF